MSDQRLLAWGRAVASRSARRGVKLPTVWLFTDTRRLPDPLPSIRALPRGRSGVVLRHDDHPAREAIASAVARACRERRLALVVAGDSRLAARVGAGVHGRGGRWPHPRLGPGRRRGLATSSAHGWVEAHRAWRGGADLIFLSPAFPTASHPGEPTLGPVRWSGLARRCAVPAMALGGVDGTTIRRLAPCAGVAAISALAVP